MRIKLPVARTDDLPASWQTIKTIDLHTGGEPLRVIVGGLEMPQAESVLESRRMIRQQHDQVRRVLMFEPRGHADMYGCVVVEPNDPQADFGIVFMHNEGYSTMCGHAIIAISTLVFQMKWKTPVEGDNELLIDAPCGRIKSLTRINNGHITGVRFYCVPSFVVGLDRQVNVPGLGTVTYDLAYGGAFYAYVEMNRHDFGFELSPASFRELIRCGMDIKRAVAGGDKEIAHPFEPELSFLYGTIFIGDPASKENDSRNVCVFADGEVDRCPTGSGVSGRMAIHHARGELRPGKTMQIESIIDSVFTGSVVEVTRYGPWQAVIPEVAGTAHLTGMHTFIVDPDDPLRDGFILR